MAIRPVFFAGTLALVLFAGTALHTRGETPAATNAPVSQTSLAAAVAVPEAGANGLPPALDRRLRDSLDELARMQEVIGAEKMPLTDRLRQAEDALLEARRAHESSRRELDTCNLAMGNQAGQTKALEQERDYLSSLLGEYVRNFETRLHIAELARYAPLVEPARLATENTQLDPAAVFATQLRVLDGSLERSINLLGGDWFAGRAAGPDGRVREGRFALIGPVAYFLSDDGVLAGIAEQRVGSLEPSVTSYADPAHEALTRTLVATGAGAMPFDGSLGNARKMEETKESLTEHIRKGGPVMAPILGVAGLAALIALIKWLQLSLVFLPGRRRLAALLEAVARRDPAAVAAATARLRGPAARMIRAGVQHIGDPKELIEETMYEQVLATRFRLNAVLPFLAVAAACAPLLGLLGTVTGIINTFTLITVFGSSDIKMLSAGISEALITTEYGLYVAIPTILLHAFLARKAKGILDRLERIAIAFLNEVVRARVTAAAPVAVASEAVVPLPEDRPA